MGKYDSKGTYAGYNKNSKERAALDYCSTPPEEVTNILNHLNIDFSYQTILEPSCGGGHMVKGISDYLEQNPSKANSTKIIATDVAKREGKFYQEWFKTGEEYDFVNPDYPIKKDVDWIIMNPPYATIEYHVLRALEIAKKGVILLGRLQFLEAQGRYEHIFKDNPPVDTYIYVDRISCLKNGEGKGDGIQAYAWYVFKGHYLDNVFNGTIKPTTKSELHWIESMKYKKK